MEKVQRRTRDELFEVFGTKIDSVDDKNQTDSVATRPSYGISALEQATLYEDEYLG